MKKRSVMVMDVPPYGPHPSGRGVSDPAKIGRALLALARDRSPIDVSLLSERPGASLWLITRDRERRAAGDEDVSESLRLMVADADVTAVGRWLFALARAEFTPERFCVAHLGEGGQRFSVQWCPEFRTMRRNLIPPHLTIRPRAG